MSVPVELATFACAELYLIIARSREITILLKQKSQRTVAEQKQVDRGLLRSVLLEILLFVPASAALVIIVLAPIILNIYRIERTSLALQVAWYGGLGVASYGFPFSLIRRAIVSAALKTLTEFAEITHKELDE